MSWRKFALFLLTALMADAASAYPGQENPEINMTTVEIIAHRGFPVEIHPVTTEDGYIITLHRIPYGRAGPPQTLGSLGHPIFLHHGITSSSVCWVITPTERSLAFNLADLGYDVWMANSRGNTYSRGHVSLSSARDEAYWNFSFDEMGRYDLPAAINYVLNVTGRKKLSYIGTSMGTTVFFVAMDYHPRLNAKVDVMVALAPVCSLANMRSPIRFIAPFSPLIQEVLHLAGVRSFMSQSSVSSRLRRRYCNRNLHQARICENLFFTMYGADPDQYDINLLPTYNSHLPAGTSVRTLAHFAQIFRSGENFVKYDFGRRENLRRYGQTTPPSYDLSKVTAPVHLFYGLGDLIAQPQDVAWLMSRLPNVVHSTPIDNPNFNHLDFLFALDAKQLVYDKVFPLLPNPLVNVNTVRTNEILGKQQ